MKKHSQKNRKNSSGRPNRRVCRPQAPSREAILAKGGLYCPIDGRCGGCMLLSVPYNQQLRSKQAEMEALFADLLDGDTCIRPIVGMKDPRHYRNKVVSPYVGVYDKKARRRRVLCGMYERGTHRVIDSRECLIENQEAKRIILAIRDLMPKFGIAPYDEDADTGFLRHVQVRVGHASGEVMVTLVTREDTFPASKAFVRALIKKHPSITTVVQNVNTRQTNVIMGDKVQKVWGDGYITDHIGKIKYQISPLSFYQVNPVQTEKLYGTALEYAGLTGGETVWDLYCGIGTISLFLAKKAKQVYGVEIVPQAIDDARNNAKINDITNAEFYVGKAEEVLPEYYKEYEKTHNGETAHADVIVVDPPRKGCEESLLQTIVDMQPEKVVYVSCDSATLARDVKFLRANGYELKDVTPVDQFPHTVHVETVCLMSRKEK